MISENEFTLQGWTSVQK